MILFIYKGNINIKVIKGFLLWIIRWVKSLLNSRTIRLCFDNEVTEL